MNSVFCSNCKKDTLSAHPVNSGAVIAYYACYRCMMIVSLNRDMCFYVIKEGVKVNDIEGVNTT